MSQYPKALYRSGEMRVVNGTEEEVDARDTGFDDWAADHNRSTAPQEAPPHEEAAPLNAEPDPSLPPARNKPGRKPKAA